MKKILVPTDFTPVSNVAIQYASEISAITKSEVHTLHIVKSKSDTDEAQAKLTKQSEEHKQKNGLDIKTIVKVGNIFDDIPKVAEEEDAELIVMGTHGLQGMQFIVGSHALRVITESKVPMVIVQEQTKKSARISRLLVPLDLHKETKQKLKMACDVAEKFSAEIHLISPKETDEYLHNRLARNVSYAEGYIEDRKIPYKTTVTESGSNGFVKELLKYAKYAEIDMICILNTTEEQLIHAFGRDSEQKLITNEAGIPVMILNLVATLKDSNSIFAQ